MTENGSVTVDVVRISDESAIVKTIELALPDRSTLHPVAAGAHIDLYLPGGLVRSYSLINESETGRYVVAVARADESRGASRYIHDVLKVGDRLQVGIPRNHFELIETAEASLLFAGGIGITPIYAMIKRLVKLGKPWHLVYGARSRANAAFVAPIVALAATSGGRVDLLFDDEPRDAGAGIFGPVSSMAAGTHVYCCGPAGMLGAFREACAHLPEAHVHFEYFAPPASSDDSPIGGFTVRLVQSALEIEVPVGVTILQALQDAGIPADFVCGEGTCGSCEVAVLEGVPDNRDHVLTAAEREAGATIMICCSGSKTKVLGLDL
ncbi:PDR/VanB family oxidoreductase [Tardiphaga sp.]|jgi:ferredoxin-NADP reductase|uniref:PDR/VanB family oxidoreductase n=1 Tax=Tardiphaga sp. TaxID=1926292 RepID=UPI0037D9C69F